MGHDLDLEFRLYCGTDGSLAYPAAYQMAAELPVLFGLIINLVTVTGHIDIFRTELQERSDRFDQARLCNALQWRYDFY